MSFRVLFRVDRDNEDEYRAAVKVLGGSCVTQFRTSINEGDLVMGRYSVLPWFKDLENELRYNGASLINSYTDHCYIAEMQWYEDIRHLTPATHTNMGWANVPDAPHGWVVKGATNSRKQKWSTHMRAPTREKLKDVMNLLYDDPLLGEQGLVIREYVPLRTYEIGVRGMPMTNEWRCFFDGTDLLGAGYYWSQAEHAGQRGVIPEEALAVAQEAANILAEHVRFFVVDVGEVVKAPYGQSGHDEHDYWTVIEVNSGQMAGLSMIDPHDFYTRIKENFS